MCFINLHCNRTLPMSVYVSMQLITQIPFMGTGDTTNYADDYLIKTCTHSSGGVETVGAPVRLLACC